MKILQSSIFRAISALAVGILLIKYPDNTVMWITVAIGVLFFLSGVISLVVYYHALRQYSKQQASAPEGVYLTDAEGNVIASKRPTFPIVGVGSTILGLLLALTPHIFVTALMYIIGAMLIIGAINQFMNLLSARHFGHVSFAYWIFPSIILLIGLYVIIRPLDPPAMAMLILGWCTLLYGVTEVINSIKIHRERSKFQKQQEPQQAVEVESIPGDTSKDETDSSNGDSEKRDDSGDEAYMPKPPVPYA
ncbi:MAG: DUF308 domain-containing protein [Prevotella sp.]|nr:DUF308 domain-containing protein [Prevotella sp.]